MALSAIKYRRVAAAASEPVVAAMAAMTCCPAVVAGCGPVYFVERPNVDTARPIAPVAGVTRGVSTSRLRAHPSTSLAHDV